MGHRRDRDPAAYVDAVISPGGTGLINTTAASRVSYGLSRNGYVPAVYERTDRRGVPWVGLLTAFVAGCICFLPFPSWRSLVGLITSASVLMYAGAPLALGVLRARLPEVERPYRLPAALVLAPLAYVVANLLILGSGWTTDYKLGIAILIGYVVLTVNRAFRLNRPRTPGSRSGGTWSRDLLLGPAQRAVGREDRAADPRRRRARAGTRRPGSRIPASRPPAEAERDRPGFGIESWPGVVWRPLSRTTGSLASPNPSRS